MGTCGQSEGCPMVQTEGSMGELIWSLKDVNLIRASDSAWRNLSCCMQRSRCEDVHVLLFRKAGRYMHICTLMSLCTCIYMYTQESIHVQMCKHTYIGTTGICTHFCVCVCDNSSCLSCWFSRVTSGKISTFGNPPSPGLLICKMGIISTLESCYESK